MPDRARLEQPFLHDRGEVQSTPIDEPLYFQSGNRRLFGWLQRPAGAARPEMGVVICNPFGYEALCAHRSVRTFAETAVDLGLVALRFDYSGTGDSADLAPGSNQLEAWVQDIHSAVNELRRRSGVQRICLLGFRFGAALAAVAGSQSDVVNALIAVAPIVSGRRYVRELRAMRLATTQHAVGLVTANEESKAQGRDGDGAMEVGGHRLEAGSIESLAKIDLAQLPRLPAQKILVIDRSDLPSASSWLDSLRALGAEADYQKLPGAIEMMLTEPQKAVVPNQMIAGVHGWLTKLHQARPTASAAHAVPTRQWRLDPKSVVPLLESGTGSPVVLRERAVFMTADPMLFGIVTEPRHEDARHKAVILLNDGATHHVGSNRMSVTVARRWARNGYVVLRMDLAGIGDSETRPGRPSNEVFPKDANKDIRAAVEFLRATYRVSEITLAGLCSGAYHALRAAASDVAIDRALMINPLDFFWDEGVTQEEIEVANTVHNAQRYTKKALSIDSLRKILTGNANLPRIARVVSQRLSYRLKALGTARGRSQELDARDDEFRLMKRIKAFDLGKELERAVGRGVRLVFVFSRGEPGHDLLKILAKRKLTRLGDNCRVRVIEGADHIFSQSGPRTMLQDLLTEELVAPRAE